MKSTIIKTIGLFLFSFILGHSVAFAQCDTIANLCEKNMAKEYLSDGQNYRALLVDKETAEFHLTLYGNSIYRFAACSGLGDGNLIFALYDKDHNLLFDNKNQNLSPYWDFKVKNTVNVTIEANLNLERLNSGCAVLLVGFKP